MIFPVRMRVIDIVRLLELESDDTYEELRIEFNGDDNTSQEAVAFEKRIDPDGREYRCLVVRNA
jgi:hypothetical protein